MKFIKKQRNLNLFDNAHAMSEHNSQVLRRYITMCLRQYNKRNVSKEEVMMNTSNEMGPQVNLDAILMLDIQYVKRGNTINVPKGTKIKVNTMRSVALINADHVHINDGEYSLLTC